MYEVQNISMDIDKLEIMEMLLRGQHTVTGVRRFLQRLEDAKSGEL